VVGWQTSAFNDQKLVLDALRRAIATRRPAPGLIHHSDRGSTYASENYRRMLDHHELVASMRRKGDFWDNAARRLRQSNRVELTSAIAALAA
jgi:transposase InsO family protein